MHTLLPFQTHHLASEMGDYIGMESCVDLQQQTVEETAEVVGDGRQRRCYGTGVRDRRWAAVRREKKEYPPPISWPFVMKRYYTGDGRLIIREEKVGHHEYFKVHRANGRLTLQLVPLDEEEEEVIGGGDDDDVVDEREDHKNNNDNAGYSNLDPGSDADDDEVQPDEKSEDRTAVEMKVESEAKVVMGGGTAVAAGGIGGGKCYNYSTSSSNVRSNPCMFGMPVPAIRPVHI